MIFFENPLIFTTKVKQMLFFRTATHPKIEMTKPIPPPAIEAANIPFSAVLSAFKPFEPTIISPQHPSYMYIK